MTENDAKTPVEISRKSTNSGSSFSLNDSDMKEIDLEEGTCNDTVKKVESEDASTNVSSINPDGEPHGENPAAVDADFNQTNNVIF
jgi:hypothetical protein